MSKTTSGNTRNYRPVSATLNIDFDSNIVNDNLRSPTWWKDQLKSLARVKGIKNVNINMDRKNIRITRTTK